MLEDKITSLTEAILCLTKALARDLPRGLQAQPRGGGKSTPPVLRPQKDEIKEEPRKETVEGPPAGSEALATPTPRQPGMTIEQLREKLLPIVQKHGAKVVGDALEVFGAKTLSELPTEQYPTLWEMVAPLENRGV